MIIVSADRPDLDQLTSAHFNLIQSNAEGWTHLMIWFPGVKPLSSSDEARMLQRAGVNLSVVPPLLIR